MFYFFMIQMAKNVSMESFFQKFGLKRNEFNGLDAEQKRVVAREYLKYKNERTSNSDILDEIVNNMVGVLNF